MVTLMVAMDDERGIGKAGSIPWHYPEDLRLFKKVTSLDNGDGRHPVVIMDQQNKTFKEVQGKRSPSRKHIS